MTQTTNNKATLMREILWVYIMCRYARFYLLIVLVFSALITNMNAENLKVYHSFELRDSLLDMSLPKPLDTKQIEEISKVELLISYKGALENGVVIGEKYNISQPLVKKAHNFNVAYICRIDSPINNLITDDEIYAIKYVLFHHQDEVLNCINKSGVNIRYDGISSHFILQDKALLNLSAKRVLAYFDNRYLMIEVLKER